MSKSKALANDLASALAIGFGLCFGLRLKVLAIGWLDKLCFSNVDVSIGRDALFGRVYTPYGLSKR